MSNVLYDIIDCFNQNAKNFSQTVYKEDTTYTYILFQQFSYAIIDVNYKQILNIIWV